MVAETQRAEAQAKAQLASILEMVKALDTEDEAALEGAREVIQEDALGVSVRSDWTTPGTAMEAVEYLILLCTGGPAVRIVGDLGQYDEPDSARLEYQDWFTPWEEFSTTTAQKEALLAYARELYFGA